MYSSSPTPAPKVSPWAALVKVITDPGATFESFGTRVPLLPGYLLQTVIGLAGSIAIMPLIMAAMDRQLAGNPAMTPQAMATSRVFAWVGAVVGAVAVPWVIGVVIAALASFFGQFQGGGVSFGSYMGMVGYARVPMVLSGIVQTVVALVAQKTTINLSAAVFLPPDANVFLKTTLAQFDPFTIWYYVLLAMGFATLHRVKPAKGTALAVTVFVLGLALALAGAALTKGLAPNMSM